MRPTVAPVKCNNPLQAHCLTLPLMLPDHKFLFPSRKHLFNSSPKQLLPLLLLYLLQFPLTVLLIQVMELSARGPSPPHNKTFLFLIFSPP